MWKLMAFCFGVFAIGTMLSAVISGRWLVNGEVNLFNALASFNAVEMQGGGGWSFIKSLGSYWDAFVTMISWNYPYLNNDWGNVFKIIFLYPISVGVVWGIIELFSIIASGAIQAIRSLLPGGGVA